MPDYDPTTVALVAEMLHVLAPEHEAEAVAYTDQLKRVQEALAVALQPSDEAPAPETEQVMRQALSRLDPKNEDQYAEYGQVLHRLLACVDRELMKWTSAVVQPIGPSGEAQVADAAKDVA